MSRPEIRFHPSPNQNARPRGRGPELVVIHGTAGKSAAGDIAWLCDEVRNPKGGFYDTSLSYHYVVARDGAITQLVPESRRAWHAGKSRWNGKEDVNDFSIGIGLTNDGKQPYPEEQLEAAAWLTADILKRRGLNSSRIVGHVDVSGPRKLDPWAHFPWTAFRVAVLVHLHPDPEPNVVPLPRAA